MSLLGPTLETQRLILRPPEEKDFEPWTEMRSHAHAMRFLGGAMSPEEVWRLATTMVGHWVWRGYGMFSMVEKISGEWIGRCGPWYPHGWPEPEIGWAVKPEFQGRGYAKEAASACLDYAVDSLGWKYLAHFIDKDNVPSIKLAERLGASWHREEVPPPPIEGLVWQVYRQTAENWKNRPAAGTRRSLEKYPKST